MIKLKSKIILAALCGIILTGCGNNAIAYFPYGDEGTGGRAYEKVTSASDISLMSDGLCVITDKNVNKLTDKPSFNAKSVIVANEESPIYAKNCFKKMYPASLMWFLPKKVIWIG